MKTKQCGIAQLAEQVAVNHRVVGSSPTSAALHGLLAQWLVLPAHNREVLGSSPREPTHAEVAQLVEHDLAKVGVAGSSPVSRSTSSRSGGIGIHNRLKICRLKRLAGSSPAFGTT
jgi:hypothetical protein